MRRLALLVLSGLLLVLFAPARPTLGQKPELKKPSKERACFGTTCGSKLASRSLGSSTVTGPSIVRNVFCEVPLRRFGFPSAGSRPGG